MDVEKEISIIKKDVDSLKDKLNIWIMIFAGANLVTMFFIILLFVVKVSNEEIIQLRYDLKDINEKILKEQVRNNTLKDQINKIIESKLKEIGD